VIFVPKYVSRLVFKDSILGGVRQFWGNLYLNSMTILFDICIYIIMCKFFCMQSTYSANCLDRMWFPFVKPAIVLRIHNNFSMHECIPTVCTSFTINMCSCVFMMN